MKRAVPQNQMLGAVEPPSRTLSDLAYRRLHADILRGKLLPDEPLLSDKLRAEYEIGISPLREALTRLVGENLVTASGQRGFRVAPLTLEIITDTLNARLLIECEALRRSIHFGGVDWEVGVVATAHALSRTPSPGESPQSAQVWSDQHRERLEATGVSFTRDRVNEHSELCRLVLTRDADAAVEWLTRHYQRTHDYVLAAFQTVAEPVSDVRIASAPRRAAKR